MQNINLENSTAREAEFINRTADSATVLLKETGGGISLPGVQEAGLRYIVGFIEVLEDHSVAMMLRFFVPGETNEKIAIRFGLLPGVKTLVCLDTALLDNRTIFTNRTPGTLKLVVHGQRTRLQEVQRVELGIEDTFHDVKIRLEGFRLTDEEPGDFPLPDQKLVDEFGQWKPKSWPGKIHSLTEMAQRMKAQEGSAEYPFQGWNRWGGDSGRKLKDAAGFFSTIKTQDGRWHLTDPDGCDFFSVGPCLVRSGEMGRIDNFEKFCDWLPDPEDKSFDDCRQSGISQRAAYMDPESYKMFNFGRANLIRVYGDDWEEKWKEISYHVLMGNGLNSQGNFPELDVNNGKSKLPYVREIRGFPATDILIFRDFPDVLSDEYREKCAEYAKTLRDWRDDPWLIGYFMRNEPEFNFVPGLAIANEVLHNPVMSHCRRGLIDFLKQKYQTTEALNQGWGTEFKSFAELEEPIDDCIKSYPASEKDLREYSVFLIREYIRVPATACRAEDPNHLNLGLRWSDAKNPDMMAGWEYFDVFSLNCYAFDPTLQLDFVKNAGVDLPILIGEFHGGALDRGLPATGLKAVENQLERGVLWQLYVEKCAAHPYGVGAHWFQYNDQFCLGRHDGENYQIGMMDVCMQPHKELFAAARETSERLYQIKNGEAPPTEKYPKKIPMIGY